jgi:hypothetical protein
MERSIAVEARSDGSRAVRKRGARAWPSGVLLAGGVAHEFPAVVPGAAAIVGADAGGRPAIRPCASPRRASASTDTAALWALDLSGVAGAPVDSTGWLLVAASPVR